MFTRLPPSPIGSDELGMKHASKPTHTVLPSIGFLADFFHLKCITSAGQITSEMWQFVCLFRSLAGVFFLRFALGVSGCYCCCLVWNEMKQKTKFHIVSSQMRVVLWIGVCFFGCDPKKSNELTLPLCSVQLRLIYMWVVSHLPIAVLWMNLKPVFNFENHNRLNW